MFPIVVAKRFLCGWIEVGEHYTGVNIAARKRRHDVRGRHVNHLGINAKLFDKGFGKKFCVGAFGGANLFARQATRIRKADRCLGYHAICRVAGEHGEGAERLLAQRGDGDGVFSHEGYVQLPTNQCLEGAATRCEPHGFKIDILFSKVTFRHGHNDWQSLQVWCHADSYLAGSRCPGAKQKRSGCAQNGLSDHILSPLADGGF